MREPLTAVIASLCAVVSCLRLSPIAEVQPNVNSPVITPHSEVRAWLIWRLEMSQRIASRFEWDFFLPVTFQSVPSTDKATAVEEIARLVMDIVRLVSFFAE